MSKPSDDPDNEQNRWNDFVVPWPEELRLKFLLNTERNFNQLKYAPVHKGVRVFISGQYSYAQKIISHEENDCVVNESLDDEKIKIYLNIKDRIDGDGPQILKPKSISPPASAEKLMYLILPKSFRDEIAGDLEEEYRSKILPKFGPDYARRWYWIQMARSIGPILWGQLTKLAKFGLFVKAAEWLTGKIDS